MRLPAMSLVLVLLACQGSPRSNDARTMASEASPRGWVTIDGVDFPTALAKAPPEIAEAYVFAAKHPEVLRYMPCYCGCQNENPPHHSNYDCFVDAIDRSGPRPRVDPDPMGFS